MRLDALLRPCTNAVLPPSGLYACLLQTAHGHVSYVHYCSGEGPPWEMKLALFITPLCMTTLSSHFNSTLWPFTLICLLWLRCLHFDVFVMLDMHTCFFKILEGLLFTCLLYFTNSLSAQEKIYAPLHYSLHMLPLLLGCAGIVIMLGHSISTIVTLIGVCMEHIRKPSENFVGLC